MKVTKKKQADGNIMLDAVATPAEVDKALQQAQVSFAMQMGLRPQRDKTIAQVAEETMGIKDLDSVVNSQAIDYLVPYAIDKKGITPAFPPHALPSSTLKRGREFAFRVSVMPKPSYELSSYDPVSFRVHPFKKDEAAVQKQIDEIRDRYAQYVKTDPHTVEKGNHVFLKIEASENGKPLTGLSTEGRTYSTGLGYMPDGFDENIIGMEVGETKSFTFEGPGIDEDGNEIVQKVDCTVTVLEMQKRELPDMNDEWIATYMPMYKSYQEFYDDIDKNVNGELKRQYDEYVRNVAAGKLAERFEGSIADAVYEAMRDNIMTNLRRELEQQDMPFDDFVEQNGGKQMFDMQVMIQTRQNLIQGYALDALFRHENLVVSDDDINDVCRMMNPRDPRAVRRDLEDNGRNFVLREAAERLCANKWLVEHAEILTDDESGKDADSSASDEAEASDSEGK